MNWIIFPFFALVLGFYVAAAHNLYLKNVPMKLVLTSFMLDFVKLVIVAILPIGNTAKALILGYLFAKAEREVFGKSLIFEKIVEFFKDLFKK
jgi:hypothetical protein